MEATARKRDPAYYREYRRRKRAERETAAQAGRIATANASPITADDMAGAIEWMEANLRVPTGPLADQPFRIPDWQREWLIEAMGDGKREAGLSVARKNGKSGLIAAFLLAVLAPGAPLNRPDYRVVVTSLTGALAKELRGAIEGTAKASGLFHALTIRQNPPPGQITGANGARVDFLAADRATGHAIGADLAIIDEAGLLQENLRALWNAIFSSVSGRNGRLWSISIQGDGPMFAELEQRAGSPTVHFRKWAAPDDCKLDDPEAWAAANPGMASGIKSASYMADAASRAVEAPGNEMHFRAYDLNQPVDPDRVVIVTVGDYADCITATVPPLEGDVVVGVDIGGAVSMTAAVALSPQTGRILCRGAFGDEPALNRRAANDRMGSLYDRMVREGELRTYPGRVTPVVPFLADFFAELADMGARVIAIGCDRYRRAEAEQAFEDARIPPIAVRWRGQGASGTSDGSHDVRAFQKLVIDKRMRTTGTTMLESAIASSVLRFDGAGNPALNKASHNSRIDCLSAAVIAAGIAELVPEPGLLKVSVV